MSFLPRSTFPSHVLRVADVHVGERVHHDIFGYGMFVDAFLDGNSILGETRSYANAEKVQITFEKKLRQNSSSELSTIMVYSDKVLVVGDGTRLITLDNDLGKTETIGVVLEQLKAASSNFSSPVKNKPSPAKIVTPPRGKEELAVHDPGHQPMRAEVVALNRGTLVTVDLVDAVGKSVSRLGVVINVSELENQFEVVFDGSVTPTPIQLRGGDTPWRISHGELPRMWRMGTEAYLKAYKSVVFGKKGEGVLEGKIQLGDDYNLSYGGQFLIAYVDQLNEHWRQQISQEAVLFCTQLRGFKDVDGVAVRGAFACLSRCSLRALLLPLHAHLQVYDDCAMEELTLNVGNWMAQYKMVEGEDGKSKLSVVSSHVVMAFAIPIKCGQLCDQEAMVITHQAKVMNRGAHGKKHPPYFEILNTSGRTGVRRRASHASCCRRPHFTTLSRPTPRDGSGRACGTRSRSMS